VNNKNILLGLLERDAKSVNNDISLSIFEGSTLTVTGATGLVGFNIICALTYYNQNYAKNPILINALSHKKPNGIMHDIFQDNGVVSFFGDLGESSFIQSIPKSDCIIHSAGYGQPGKFLDDKIKTISINTSATIGLSKRLKQNGRFLFLSSSEVYSGSPNSKNNESHIGNTDPSHPRSCYIEGKRTGEAIVNALREKGMNAASARLALAYGPGVKSGDKRALYQFIEQGLNGEIKLLDGGDALRTYAYISDVITMLLSILIKSDKAVYNVGGVSETSIRDLANKIGMILNVSVDIPRSEQYLSDAPSRVSLDLSRIKKEFNIPNHVCLDEGLKNTIQWVRYFE
jgi:UDP-glucuronate decarboxylase